jgi:hypothetical protein
MVVGVRGPKDSFSPLVEKAPMEIFSAKRDPKGGYLHEQIRISKTDGHGSGDFGAVRCGHGSKGR